MAVRTRFFSEADSIPERSSWRYRCTLMDEAGVAIPGAGLATLTLTLYDLSGGAEAIVNSVNDVNILNLGRGSIGDSGVLTITFTPADSQILTATNARELRRALIEWTYGVSGEKAGAHEVDFMIVNLSKRT